jgi:hypothetical protein
MNVKLRMIDRLALLAVLPGAGSYMDMRAVQDLRYALAPTQDEAVELEKAASGNGMLKDTDAVALVEAEFEIGARAKTIIEDTLKSLEQAKKLPQNLTEAWARFFGTTDSKGESYRCEVQQ